MALEKMKRYNLNVNGVDHVIRLNDDDAEAHKDTFGDKLTPAKPKARKTAANKSRTPANKGADSGAGTGDTGTGDAGDTK
jgi:hypothetical protein